MDAFQIKHDTLKREVRILEENLDDISFGLYKPHYSFQTSEKYKLKLDEIWNLEKNLIKDGKAAVCSQSWHINGNSKDGEKLSKQFIKLALRAFNGECDAALSKVTWNNIIKMEERIQKCYEAINKMTESFMISITPAYLKLKIDELRLTFEYEDKKHDEQEEQKRIREQIREEEKVRRELDKAEQEAEREEDRYQKALDKAREEAANATGAKVQVLDEKIRLLESQLEEAHQKKERAISRAQQTKSGHVYVISNIGSFGDAVLKVGMTRIDPLDRIFELGDASVPFPFDVHAMIYSENAPELESQLHRMLGEQRVNMVNQRKEFFQTSLSQVEVCAKKLGLKLELTMIAEAREFRESLAIRNNTNGNKLLDNTLISSNPSNAETHNVTSINTIGNEADTINP